MKKLNKKMTGKSLRIPALLLVTALILAVTAGITFARYVLKEDHSGLAEADTFYFESDYLKEEGANYTVYTGSVNITIANHDGLNTTSKDISYTTTGFDSNEHGTLNSTQKSKTYTLSGNDGEEKKVSVTSTEPYEKTLSATFSFKDAGENTVYEVKDHGYYMTLELYTGAKPGEITVNYGSKLAPDTADEKMSGWLGGSSGTLSGLSPNAHYSLVFFENEAVDYTGAGQQILGGDNIIKMSGSN